MTHVSTPPRHPMEAESPGARARAVRAMFSAIAPRYDTLNRLLSLNLDRSWRRRAVDRLGWESRSHGLYLDLCAGTHDLGLELARRPGFGGRVIAVDFALSMLRKGQSKIAQRPISPACADALDLPLAAGRVDGALIAFGIRNLADIEAGLHELRRVMRTGGRLVILDFSLPTRRPFKQLYRFYFTRLVPVIGKLVSKHSFAYSYLPESVAGFGAPAELAARLRDAGFGEVGWQRLTGGVVCVWWGVAPAGRSPGS